MTGPAFGANVTKTDRSAPVNVAELKCNAAAGNASAQFDLAMLYLTGRFGVDKKAEALPLLAAAAGQKDNRMP
jgi:TPR repeat protein